MTLLAAFVCLTCTAFTQSTDEEAIKKTIQADHDAFTTHNLDAMKAAWKHDPTTFTTFVSRYNHTTTKGWDSIAAQTERDWKANPTSNFSKLTMENVTIRQNGNTALVDYDAVVMPVNPQPDVFPYTDVIRLHNYETLVKEGDGWKITSRVMTWPESYKGDDHTTETDLNATGYRLLAANKINEAIDVFKLNVKLFPKSHNTYDSLGEAYALAGNKKLAIENYEKALKLNPKSESAPAALAKLKGK